MPFWKQRSLAPPIQLNRPRLSRSLVILLLAAAVASALWGVYRSRIETPAYFERLSSTHQDMPTVSLCELLVSSRVRMKVVMDI